MDPKLLYLGVLGSNLKKLLSYLKLALSNLLKCKVSWKTKKPNIWDWKYLIWAFLGRFLKKTVIIFELSALGIVQVKNKSCKTRKKIGEQNTYYFGTFRLYL